MGILFLGYAKISSILEGMPDICFGKTVGSRAKPTLRIPRPPWNATALFLCTFRALFSSCYFFQKKKQKKTVDPFNKY